MRLLVNGTTRIVREMPDSPYLGHLMSPRCGVSLDYLRSTRLPVAADNGCFKRFEPDRFLRMLDRAGECADRVAFVCLPDVVADARATMDLFEDWAREVTGRGLPAALVMQDGLERLEVPWDRLDALFVGGSTAWKLGRHAARLGAEGKARGKLLHMGRVNSFRRFKYAYAIGCDSLDGGQFSWFPDTHIPDALGWLERLHRRPPAFPRGWQRNFLES
jgi:hypothetical protein